MTNPNYLTTEPIISIVPTSKTPCIAELLRSSLHKEATSSKKGNKFVSKGPRNAEAPGHLCDFIRVPKP